MLCTNGSKCAKMAKVMIKFLQGSAVTQSRDQDFLGSAVTQTVLGGLSTYHFKLHIFCSVYVPKIWFVGILAYDVIG